jgi:predicted glutamine amidotransferase
MCGITGFIGKSKKPSLTYEITTSVFRNLESRGIDASGLWGSVFDKNTVYYHKEPIKSSVFVETSFWNNMANVDFDLLLLHCRAASQGVGKPVDNKNNHPFVNNGKNIAVVHNGRAPEFEYLKNKFSVRTECDSEIFLRIFESCNDKLSAINEICSLLYKSHMAVAIGEKNEEYRRLWLFRNEHRPLWIVDLRDLLGQIFFVSTPEIWIDSVNVAVKNKSKFFEVAPHNLFCFTLDKSLDYKSYEINISNEFEDLDMTPVVANSATTDLEVITELTEDEQTPRTYITNNSIEDDCIQIFDMLETIHSHVLNDVSKANEIQPYLLEVKSNIEKIFKILT